MEAHNDFLCRLRDRKQWYHSGNLWGFRYNLDSMIVIRFHSYTYENKRYDYITMSSIDENLNYNYHAKIELDKHPYHVTIQNYSYYAEDHRMIFHETAHPVDWFNIMMDNWRRDTVPKNL